MKVKADERTEVRCTNCGKLLAIVRDSSTVEMKCPRCKTMNTFTK